VKLLPIRISGCTGFDVPVWRLQSQGVEVCPATLGERVTYQDAYAQGQSVGEAEPAGQGGAGN
jgi:hypothetical protein